MPRLRLRAQLAALVRGACGVVAATGSRLLCRRAHERCCSAPCLPHTHTRLGPRLLQVVRPRRQDRHAGRQRLRHAQGGVARPGGADHQQQWPVLLLLRVSCDAACTAACPSCACEQVLPYAPTRAIRGWGLRGGAAAPGSSPVAIQRPRGAPARHRPSRSIIKNTPGCAGGKGFSAALPIQQSRDVSCTHGGLGAG